MTDSNGAPFATGASFSFGEMALTAEPGRGPAAGLSTSRRGAPSEGSTESAAEKLLRDMRSLMLNEEYSPEILQYATETVTGVQGLVAEQEDALDTIEFGGEGFETPTGFEVHIKRMEIDRVNYLLRSYFRVRIKKIERSVLYVLKEDNPDNTFDKLSEAEQKFAKMYMDLVEGHFNRSFMDMLPEKLRKLDKDGNVHHAVPPNMDKFAFCRMKKRIGSYAVSDEATDEDIELNEGDILCTRYSRIRELLIRGDAELV